MIDGFTLTLPGILQGGAGGIVAVGVYMFYTGRIVSRRVLEDVRKDRDDRVADAKEQIAIWRAAHDTRVAESQESVSIMRESLETSRMVLHLVRSLRAVATDEGHEDETKPP